MKILFAQKPKKRANLIFALFDKEIPDKSLTKHLSKKDRDYITLFTKKEKIKANSPKTALLPASLCHVLFFGKGNKKSWDKRKARLLIRNITAELKKGKITEGTIFASSIVEESDKEKLLEFISSELIISDFDFNLYKETPKEGWPEIKNINIVIDFAFSEKEMLKLAIESGIIIGEETNHARRLSNTPGGDMTPEKLALEAKTASKKTGLECTIFDLGQIEKLGMGGILGVSKGSTEKPKFIILEHKPKTYEGSPLVLVGKGVTFDTGGLNLKPDKAINEMHLDMSGGAAVIHALAAIARLNIPMHVIGLIPAVENMPSGSSYRPGDILKSITGKTIEVLNTDAEGRIILADALGYAKNYDPRMVVDIATLTGAAAVAIGQRASALFTKNEELELLFRKLGEESGDYLWPLPLWDEFTEDIKGTFADIANVGKPEYGGAITAAAFLKEFVSYPWAHIDMAPTMTTIASDKLAKGAKGTGVRLFVELARHLSKQE